MKIPPDEIAQLLRDIRRGVVAVEGISGGIAPTWYTSNGYTIQVFDDAGEWDYIQYVKTSDGRESEFRDIYPDSENILIEDEGGEFVDWQLHTVAREEPDRNEAERVWHYTETWRLP